MNSNDTGHATAVRSRPVAGAGWGALATVAMSAVMLLGTATGVAPMPEPVPAALVAHTFDAAVSPALLAAGLLAHLCYGAVAGGLFAWLVPRTRPPRRAGPGTGSVWGVLLWLLMGLVWLPYLGWGVFGTAVDPRIAVATLVLHLIYGVVLGSLLGRSRSRDGA